MPSKTIHPIWMNALKTGYVKNFNRQFSSRAQRKATWLCIDPNLAIENLQRWVDDMIASLDESPILTKAYQQHRLRECGEALRNHAGKYSLSVLAEMTGITAFVIVQGVFLTGQQKPQFADILAELWFREVTPGFLKLDMRGPEIVKLTPYTPADCSFF